MDAESQAAAWARDVAGKLLRGTQEVDTDILAREVGLLYEEIEDLHLANQGVKHYWLCENNVAAGSPNEPPCTRCRAEQAEAALAKFKADCDADHPIEPYWLNMERERDEALAKLRETHAHASGLAESLREMMGHCEAERAKVADLEAKLREARSDIESHDCDKWPSIAETYTMLEAERALADRLAEAAKRCDEPLHRMAAQPLPDPGCPACQALAAWAAQRGKDGA